MTSTSAMNDADALGRPTNVVEALACVMRELPAIAKVQHNDGRGGLTYKFRGIEEITAEAQGLFAKYGVIVVPRVRDRMVKDIVVNGNPWTDTFLEVDWTLYGPGGTGDFIEATTFGQGRDNSDKGTNKSQTQAFKYLLLEVLMVADPKDDTDGTNTENQLVSAPRVNGTYGFEEVNGELLPLDPPMTTTRSGPAPSGPTEKQLNYAKALLKGVNVDTKDDTDGTNTENQLVSAPRVNGTYGFEEVNGELLPLDPPMTTTRSGPAPSGPTEKQLNYAKALLKGVNVDTKDDDAVHAWWNTMGNDLPGAWPGSLNNLSKAQCSAVIECLKPA